MTTNDFMPLSLDTLRTASANSAAKTNSSTPTAEQLEEWGYTVADTDNALGLDFTDFLQLMVQQLQNQTIDNATDTSDMLNQLVQMSTIQAITNITDATVMMYAGSLVGKEVTIGQYNSDGTLEELVGVVTGTGVAGGQQVIFVNGESYYLSQIMAVGRLPDVEEPEPDPGEDGDGDITTDTDPDKTPGVEGTEDTTDTTTPNLDFDAPGVVG